MKGSEDADLETLMATYEVDELLIGDIEKGKDGPPIPTDVYENKPDEEDALVEPDEKKLKHLGFVWLLCR